MARTIDKGLDYTSLDVSFFQDRKIRKLQRRCGPSAPLVYIALICAVFREGYFLALDDDLVCDIADETRLDEDSIRKAIECCAECDLISKRMLEEYGVLTSAGIQRQYQEVCEKGRRKSRVDRYSLLDSEENPEDETPEETRSAKKPSELMQKKSALMPINAKNSALMPINAEEMPINAKKSALMPINAEKNCINATKKSKVKESKVNYYYCSSSEQWTEEQQQQFFLSEIFFRNWGKPQEELRKFVNYNNTGGRSWARMTFEQRRSSLELWKQTPATEPRMAPDGLALWRRAYEAMLKARAPDGMLEAALSEGVDVRLSGGNLYIACPKELQEYFDANIRLFRPIFIPPESPGRRVSYLPPKRC